LTLGTHVLSKISVLPKSDIARRRLVTQRLAGATFKSPVEAVSWFCAVQSQDYAGAKWALGQRTGLSEAALDRAFDAGEILRTHVLRPTWHFVAPEDLRDLLALTGPRVAAGLAGRWRELDLPAEVRSRATGVLVSAIAERGPLTRAELGQALQHAGIDPAGQRLPHLLMQAELEAVLCSGGLRGRQQTWALLDDRVPPSSAPFDRDAALRMLAVRYATSHGPVTERDFGWWSGLTLADVRKGLELGRPDLDALEIAGRRYWFGEPPPADASPGPVVRLLQSYDEFVVAYSESRDLVDPEGLAARMPRGWLLSTVLVVDGRLAGRWQRAIRPDRVEVDVTTFAPLHVAARAALIEEAERFGAFLDLPLRLQIVDP
jgi:winged helix DNA-binding protein